MKAVLCQHFGIADDLVIGDIADPVAGPKPEEAWEDGVPPAGAATAASAAWTAVPATLTDIAATAAAARATRRRGKGSTMYMTI